MPCGVPVFASAGWVTLWQFPATMWRHVKNFLLFLREEKAWWLVPLIVIFILLAAVLLFNGSAVLAPFMYPVL